MIAKHPLDDLTAEQRAHLPTLAVNWLEDPGRPDPDNLGLVAGDTERTSCDFAMALLTMELERDEARAEVERLKAKLTETRASRSIWRTKVQQMDPVVEAAKDVIAMWSASAGDFTYDVGRAVDILFATVSTYVAAHPSPQAQAQDKEGA